MRTIRNHARLTASALMLCIAATSGAALAHGDKGGRFKRADKNGDGFITQDEVSERKWARIQVADANKDGKISLEELKQAKKDGKLKKKHRGDRDKGGKA